MPPMTSMPECGPFFGHFPDLVPEEDVEKIQPDLQIVELEASAKCSTTLFAQIL